MTALTTFAHALIGIGLTLFVASLALTLRSRTR
jgi:hypothetical protein